MQAPVDSLAPPNLVIRGVEIQTNAVTVFKDFAPNRPTAAQFFAILRSGTLVKVKGVVLRGTSVAIQATQVELADPDRDDDL